MKANRFDDERFPFPLADRITKPAGLSSFWKASPISEYLPKVIHFFEQGSQIDEYLASGPNSEIIFTLSAETEEEVKEWAEKVKNAGGKLFHEVGRDETNHYGFAFADPDGHKFNVLLIEEGM